METAELTHLATLVFDTNVVLLLINRQKSDFGFEVSLIRFLAPLGSICRILDTSRRMGDVSKAVYWPCYTV